MRWRLLCTSWHRKSDCVVVDFVQLGQASGPMNSDRARESAAVPSPCLRFAKNRNLWRRVLAVPVEEHSGTPRLFAETLLTPRGRARLHPFAHFAPRRRVIGTAWPARPLGKRRIASGLVRNAGCPA